mmetsp:Transcript_37223/g.90323  ORF Transcript_37223/g.90323 Transcript_37223/m.90323 type:complete len:290 (+) Transcript_37223:67-936(+)
MFKRGQRNNNDTAGGGRGGKILGRQSNQYQQQQRQQSSSSSYGTRKTTATKSDSRSQLKENTPMLPQAPRSVQQHPNHVAASAAPFSQAEIQELTNSFNLFDVHGTGSVKVGEFRSVLEMLQQEQEQQGGGAGNNSSSRNIRIDTLIERLGYFVGEDVENTDDETMLTLDDYLQLMETTTVTGSMNNDEEDASSIAAIFDLFDTDGKGYITIDDLYRISVDLGEQMTQEELEEMIRRAKMLKNDTSSMLDGQPEHGHDNDRVTLEEFQRILQTNLSIPLRDDEQQQQQS